MLENRTLNFCACRRRRQRPLTLAYDASSNGGCWTCVWDRRRRSASEANAQVTYWLTHLRGYQYGLSVARSMDSTSIRPIDAQCLMTATMRMNFIGLRSPAGDFWNSPWTDYLRSPRTGERDQSFYNSQLFNTREPSIVLPDQSDELLKIFYFLRTIKQSELLFDLSLNLIK